MNPLCYIWKMTTIRISFLAFCIFLFLDFSLHAQYYEPKPNENDPSIPEWVKLMYAESPNAIKVDDAFRAYYAGRPFKHDNYSRYYKRWRRFVTPYVEDNGDVVYPSLQERLSNSWQIQPVPDNVSRAGGDDWTYLGPDVHLNAKYNAGDANVPVSKQANVYSVDRCTSNPLIMYCGTESGGVYKSIDKGQNWFYVTKGLTVEGVSAVGVDPSNPDIALFSSANEIFKTTDGGDTWTVTGNAAFQALNISVWQFSFNPIDPSIVHAATNTGLYRSTDNGSNWTQIFTGESMSVEYKIGNPSIVYALRYNVVSQIAEFYKSTDGGLTFSVRPNGWFTVPEGDAGLITSRGGRIALTEANPNRVYVLLVGSSQEEAVLQLRGTIGVYSSADSGDNWSFPHNQLGMPYDLATHPNLMDFDGHSSTYSQIYYNTALACSHLDENALLIGGLNLWRSNDGGASYSPVGGYVGGLPLMHVDLQEFRNYKTSATTEEIWFSSDGGLNFSTDWCNSHVSLTKGIGAVNFWGLDQGWNDDIIVGGRYHNGNGAYSDSYGPGTFLSLGGGENATGYVNYSPERKTYFSDIGGRIIPIGSGDLVKRFDTNQFPNESYYDNNSSRIIFDWEYWNIAYSGNANNLMMSTNGGSSFSNLYTFSDATSKVLWIEQSHANPQIIYVQLLVNSISKLYKSIDGGNSFTEIALPQSKREIYFSLSYTNEQELWLAFTAGSNGNKVYQTINGGSTWNNITTSTLNGLSIKAIAHQAGTNLGVYIASRRGPVHYKNATMSDWQTVGTSVPSASYPLRVMPFYPKGKLRLGMWNIGVWEHDLAESSQLIADFSSNFSAFTCPGDTMWFVNHSVCDANATFQWTFEGGSPATSSLKAPKVTYSLPGTYNVQLIVNQGGTSDTISKSSFITTLPAESFPFSEDFESGSLAEGWKNIDDGEDGEVWEVRDDISAFGLGTNCIRFNNYAYDVSGNHDQIITRTYNGVSAGSSISLHFDVAYARWAANYSDTLAVYISYDCGNTLELIYLKGGTELATAPDNSSNTFVPTDTQWRTDSATVFSITNPNEYFVLVFENRGHYGQPIYIDNILVDVDGLVTDIPSELKAQISIYPVPAENTITLKIEGFEGHQLQYQVFDGSGRLCLIGQASEETIQVNTSVLSSGYYLIQVGDGKQQVRRPFMKK
jgi:PKD repeat protein/photosystem II stability/assembly factor-like uncharacterized protein